MDATRRHALIACAASAGAGWTGAAFADDGPVLATTPKIARVWHGRTPLARAGDYRTYLYEAGVKRIAKIPGNRGVQMLMRETADEAEFMVLSYWDSIEAIKGYAGAGYEHVHDLPRDAEFLIDKETLVRHFDLAVNYWST